MSKGRWLIRVNWTNTGAAPILRPHLIESVEGRLVPRGFLGERAGITATVAPGASGGKPLPALAREPKDLYLEFTDGRGRLWWPELDTGRYFSKKKMVRWMARSARLFKGEPRFVMPGALQPPSKSVNSGAPSDPLNEHPPEPRPITTLARAGQPAPSRRMPSLR